MGFCPEGDTIVNPWIKYSLLLGTFFLWVFGAGVVAVGIWAFVEKDNFNFVEKEEFTEEELNTYHDFLHIFGTVVIIVGIIMFVITISGFVGSLRENTCLLRFFYITLSVILLLEIVTGALALVLKDRIKLKIKNIHVEEYHDSTVGLMDYFQEKFKCCGIDSYKDWNKNPYFNCTEDNRSGLKCAVPYSCCKDPDAITPGLVNVLCGGGTLNTSDATLLQLNKIYTEGCVPVVLDIFTSKANLVVIGALVFAILLPQLIFICLGRILVGQIEGQWGRYYQAERQKAWQWRMGDRMKYFYRPREYRRSHDFNRPRDYHRSEDFPRFSNRQYNRSSDYDWSDDSYRNREYEMSRRQRY